MKERGHEFEGEWEGGYERVQRTKERDKCYNYNKISEI